MNSKIDTVIVGAGPGGLCAAKTILQCQPFAEIKILDAHTSIGGVWASELLFPGLRTNNRLPDLDFSDFPMPTYLGVKYGDFLTGEAYHEYLVAYAKHWKIAERVQLNTKVLEAAQLEKEEGWQLRMEVDMGNIQTMKCKKLIIATGSTHVPQQPNFKGSLNFVAPILHSSELGYYSDRLTTDSETRTIAVTGGGKSAYDAVYLAATAGKQVEWIIRKSGRGPVWLFPTKTHVGPFEVWTDKMSTRRIVSILSPCIWDDGFAWIRRLFHYTEVGKKFVHQFWANMHAATSNDCGCIKEEKLSVLEPQTSPYWYGTAGGVNNYTLDFHSFVRSGQVRIHREDIDHLSSHTIHLADAQNTNLTVDALVTATGYCVKPTIKFIPSSNSSVTESDLGIPTGSLHPSEKEIWEELDQKADLYIRAQFPSLIIGPHPDPDLRNSGSFNRGSSGEHEAKYTPWRLYRAMAPPGLTMREDRSLVFVGMITNVFNCMRVEIQCLWAYVYLFGRIPQLESDVQTNRIFEETSLMQRFFQHRTPYGHGRFHADLVFDQVPYFDILLRDLGLETKRKLKTGGWFNRIGGWFREMFEPYNHFDYQGLVNEWLRKNTKM